MDSHNKNSGLYKLKFGLTSVVFAVGVLVAGTFGSAAEVRADSKDSVTAASTVTSKSTVSSSSTTEESSSAPNETSTSTTSTEEASSSENQGSTVPEKSESTSEQPQQPSYDEYKQPAEPAPSVPASDIPSSEGTTESSSASESSSEPSSEQESQSSSSSEPASSEQDKKESSSSSDDKPKELTSPNLFSIKTGIATITTNHVPASGEDSGYLSITIDLSKDGKSSAGKVYNIKIPYLAITFIRNIFGLENLWFLVKLLRLY